MSKALVIKNADFSANKVTTITFNEEVPCTGVSFDSASVSLSSLGQASIPYTVTPINTTDAVTITSSDPSVLEVNGNEVNAVGIGSAILTVRCGNYSDTCEVTVNVVVNPIYFAGYIGTATSGSDSGATLSTSSRRPTLVQNLSDTDFGTPMSSVGSSSIPYENLAPIPIPNNATKIHIECSNLYSGNNAVYFFANTSDTFVFSGNSYTKTMSEVTLSVSSGTINTDVTIPEGAKGAIVALRQKVDYNQIFANCTSEAEVKAIVDETFHAVVSYKAS